MNPKEQSKNAIHPNALNIQSPPLSSKSLGADHCLNTSISKKQQRFQSFSFWEDTGRWQATFYCPWNFFLSQNQCLQIPHGVHLHFATRNRHTLALDLLCSGATFRWDSSFEVMLIRHWALDAFLLYIWHQILEFTIGTSQNISNKISYFSA